MLPHARRALSAIAVAALLVFAPLVSTTASAAPGDTLTYTGGNGRIQVTVTGTSLTATWPASSPHYRVHLWDNTTRSYVLLNESTAETSYSATITRGHSYLAFYQTVDAQVYVDDWVDFTPPPFPAPNSPQNLTATRLTTATGVDLAWSAPADNAQNPAIGYRIDVSNGGATEIYTTSQLTLRLTGLTVPSQYSFSVTAITADNQSSAPATISETIGSVAPTQPLAVTLTRDGGAVTANWSPPAYDGGSTISYFLEVYVGDEPAVYQGASGTSLLITAAAEYERAYRVIVYAMSQSGVPGPGTASNTVTRPLPAPQPPTALATTRLSDANGFDLTWVAPTDTLNPASSYTVDVISSDGTVRYTTTDPGYRVTGLVTGREYTFAVSSVAADAQVSTAATTPVTLNSTDPTAVTDLALTVAGDQLSATWSAPSYDGGASPLRYEVALFGDSQLITSYEAGTRTIAIPHPAEYGVSYQVEVTAITDDDLQGPTTGSNSIMRADWAPDAPVAYAEGYGYKDAMVYLTWDLAAPVGSPIQRLLVTLYDASGAVVQQQQLSSAYTSYSFSGLQNATDYTASVVAINLAGNSLESNRATASTLGLVPPAYTPQQLQQYGNSANVTVELSGTELVAHLDGLTAGTWVFGYAYSSPVALGWTQVDAAGFARWSISGAGLTAGASHTLAVQDSFGASLGFDTFDIAAAPSALAHTGGDSLNWAVLAIAMLALGALVRVRRARRNA